MNKCNSNYYQKECNDVAVCRGWRYRRASMLRKSFEETAKQSLGLYELKQHKQWLHEEYLQLRF